MTQYGALATTAGFSTLVLGPADGLSSSLTLPGSATGTSSTTVSDDQLFGGTSSTDGSATAGSLSMPSKSALTLADSATPVAGQLVDPGSDASGSASQFAFRPSYDSRSIGSDLRGSLSGTVTAPSCGGGATTVSGSGSGADTISSSGIAALPYNPSLTLGIFGTSDTRTPVTNSAASPYNGIAYVTGTFADGESFSATAFYIDATHLVTAGHVAYDLSEGGGFVTSLTVTAGRNGSTAGTTETVSQVAVDPTWYASGSSNENYDLAVLTVSNPTGYTPTTFSLAADSTATLTGLSVSTTGYPGEKGSGTLQGTYQYTATGTIDQVSNNELYSTHLPITAGDSGSPVYTTASNGTVSAVGIAAWGSTTTDGYTRLTTADVSEIDAYVAASDAGTLTVGSAATAVTGGMIAENVTGATRSAWSLAGYRGAFA